MLLCPGGSSGVVWRIRGLPGLRFGGVAEGGVLVYDSGLSVVPRRLYQAEEVVSICCESFYSRLRSIVKMDSILDIVGDERSSGEKKILRPRGVPWTT